LLLIQNKNMKKIQHRILSAFTMMLILSFTQKQFIEMETQKISVLIRFKAKKGQTQALANHLTEAANQLTINEEETEIFTVSTTPIDPEAVYVYEVYSSAEAKAKHETGDAYNAIRAKTGDFVDGPPQVIPLTPVGGKGLK
jgi:quinol monooxygenase YgiN